MHKEVELWRFVADRLAGGEDVMLLVVAESSGSSPGRQGYKMAVGADGELSGSIGGGVMEVKLVEESRQILSDAETRGHGDAETSFLTDQVHRENSPHASGMICSGKQTVIFKVLTSEDSATVDSIVASLQRKSGDLLTITPHALTAEKPERGAPNAPQGEMANPQSQIPNPKSDDFTFEKLSDTEFRYTEILGHKNHLYIIGGGHCALALSELMSKMDFHISLFDDRPELNTIAKNEFAHDIKIVDSYERIGDHIASGRSAYVVVMTLGYKTDEIVIRGLIDKEFKYFGVLGSKAKMATMLRSLRNDGLLEDKLSRLRTPIGLPINSRTPEEIAISIAAEIISVKNAEP